jgi:hypothetical protein
MWMVLTPVLMIASVMEPEDADQMVLALNVLS